MPCCFVSMDMQSSLMMRSLLWLGLSLVLLASCKKEDAPPPQEYPGISYGFEEPLEAWVEQGGGGERAFEADIQQSSLQARTGTSSGLFTVSPDSYVANGKRAELTFDQGAGEGVLSSYRWSLFIPADYPDVVLRDETGAPNWQVIGQWHQQPVWEDGEDWEDFTGIGASPPVAVYYNYLSTGDPAYQQALNDPALRDLPGFDPDWDEVSTLTFVTGGESVLISQIQKGQWQDIRMDIYWSQGADGYIRVWLNNSALHDGPLYGATMLNKASHYFKIGLYRNPRITVTHQLYIDAIEVAEIN